MTDWGVIHHVPRWRDAVREAARVLKPGGWFLFFEVPGHKIRSRLYRALFDHPLDDRFESEEFREACESAGMTFERPPSNYFGFFYGAACKRPGPRELSRSPEPRSDRGSTG